LWSIMSVLTNSKGKVAVYNRAPVFTDSVSTGYRDPKK
jgi:hypothetical protein